MVARGSWDDPPARHLRPADRDRWPRGRRLAQSRTTQGVWTVFAALAFVVVSHPRLLFASLPDALWQLAVATIVTVAVTIRSARMPPVPWTVVAFLVYCGASSSWSIDAGDTWGAVLFYGTIALVGVVLGASARPADILAGLSGGAVIVAVASVAAALLDVPGAGGDPLGRAALQGFHGNRNIVSYVLVLGLCAALARSGRPGPGRGWRFAAVVVVVAGIVVSISGTGLVVAFALLGLALVVRAFGRLSGRQRSRTLAGAAVVATGALLLVVLRPGLLVAALGKDLTFSGRTPQWEAIIEVSGDAWAGGYGWGAVWTYSWFPTGWNTVKGEIDAMAGYPLSHGHNIVLDVLAQAGVIGVVLMLVIIVRMLWGMRGRPVSREVVLFAWLLVAALFLNGATEPLFTVPLGWFFVVLADTMVRQAGREPDRQV